MRFFEGNKLLSAALAAQALVLPMTNGAAVAPRVSALSKRAVPNKIEACAPEGHKKYQPGKLWCQHRDALGSPIIPLQPKTMLTRVSRSHGF